MSGFFMLCSCRVPQRKSRNFKISLYIDVERSRDSQVLHGS